MRDWKEECGFPPRMCIPSMRDWTEWTPPGTCFDPMTMMIGSMVAGAGSSIMGGIGQQQQYSAQAASSRYQAQVAENNRRSPSRMRATPGRRERATPRQPIS